MNHLKDIEVYEKVFCMRNYGYTIVQSEELKLEGQDYIKKADELERQFPYWSQRKLHFFVPILS